MVKLSSQTKKIISISFLTLLYVLLQVAEELLYRKHIFHLNGILMAFQFVVCFIIVIRDFKLGRIICQLCLGGSLLLILSFFIINQNPAPLPGFFCTIIYLVTISILALQFEKRDKENVSDFLTGLLNERGLHRLISTKMENHQTFFLLGINIQNYSAITANYGHSHGELLLKKLASEITATLDGNGSAALIKGKEFFIVINGEAYATGVAYGIMSKLSEKKTILFNDNEAEVYLNLCAGFSKYPDDSQTPDELIKFSDIAMYHAGKTKNTNICHFEPGMEETINRQMRIEKLIKTSIQNNYFFLVYQPQYHLDGKTLRGFETLLRINSPHGDSVGPAEFIPIAEKSDLILKIDDYVIVRAMNEFKDIIKNDNKDLIVSINVSAKNIGSPEFTSKILKYLTQTDFPAENLEIEITEYCLVQSIDVAIENIRELRKMGVKVALDDFGTGYTSLSYLAKMPVNLLKVDKSLIDDIETDKKILEFVSTVISLGHLMNCEVISEGVENENQLSLLKDKNCDLIQGYVWGKPLTYEVAKQLAKSN